MTPSAVGLAAELLVCHDLICNGVMASMSAFGNSDYDVLARVGNEFLKVQVKATNKSGRRFRFRMRGGNKKYSAIDLFCFVHVPTKTIFYVAPENVKVTADEISFLVEKFIVISRNSLEKFLKQREAKSA